MNGTRGQIGRKAGERILHRTNKESVFLVSGTKAEEGRTPPLNPPENAFTPDATILFARIPNHLADIGVRRRLS
jgi:hypothetical protein